MKEFFINIICNKSKNDGCNNDLDIENKQQIKRFKKSLKFQKKVNRAKYGVGRKYTVFLITMLSTCFATIALIVFMCFMYFNPIISESKSNLETSSTSNTETNASEQDTALKSESYLVEEKNSRVESGIVATGMTVIGIAIAVWAGLNIVNAIERKEFQDLNERLSEQTKLEFNELNIESFRESFLIELFKTQSDPFSLYFYREFSKYRINSIEKIPYDKLLQIEQKYSQVYFMHTSKKETNKILLQYANDGILIINNIDGYTADINNKVFEEYLLSRLYDFYFYQGYCMEDNNNACACFLKAAKGFLNLSKKMDLGLPSPKEICEKNKYEEVNSEKIDLCIYFANAIGESYSKNMRSYSTNNNKKREFGDCAIGYCKLAVYLLSSLSDKNQITSEREVYYRNYAVALENYNNLFGTIDYKEILNNYKKSFKLILNDNEDSEKRVKSVYYALLSYYHRLIEKLSGISGDNYKSSNDIKYNEYINDTFALDKMNDNFNESINVLKEFYLISNFAACEKNRMRLTHIMKAFSLRDIIIYKSISEKRNDEKNEPIEIIENSFPETITMYKEKFNRVIELLDYMNIVDPYYEQLTHFNNEFLKNDK